MVRSKLFDREVTILLCQGQISDHIHVVFYREVSILKIYLRANLKRTTITIYMIKYSLANEKFIFKPVYFYSDILRRKLDADSLVNLLFIVFILW